MGRVVPHKCALGGERALRRPHVGERQTIMLSYWGGVYVPPKYLSYAKYLRKRAQENIEWGTENREQRTENREQRE